MKQNKTIAITEVRGEVTKNREKKLGMYAEIPPFPNKWKSEQYLGLASDPPCSFTNCDNGRQ